MSDTGTNINDGLYSDLIIPYIFDVISLLIIIIAAIFVLIASIKLYKHCKLPGINYIFYSTTGSLISFFSYTVYTLLFSFGENAVFEQITNILFSILFSLGAYGFWLLAKYLIHNEPH